MAISTVPDQSYRFDEFELDPGRRTFSRLGEKVTLAPKTFDVLLCLIANAGNIVSKEELFRTVWPGAFVEESNLTQHIFWLRKALADRSTLIVNIPSRGYQLTAPVETITPQASPAPAPPTTNAWLPAYWPYAAIIVLLCGLIGWGMRQRISGSVPAGDHHEVVLADFQNDTGDPTFNHTLDTLLAIDLNQSPYLAIASEDDTHQALKLMDKPTDAALTPPIAREVCQRINDQAVLTGAIARIGTKYLITLSATDCQTGKALVQQKATAARRESVIDAVDTVAATMRQRLGESLHSHNHPTLPPAHTFSLDALRAYAQATELSGTGRNRDAIPLYQRAIQLDPKFAAAYLDLARTYGYSGEETLSRQTASKAYDLRDQGDDFLRLKIISYYNYKVTGDLRARLATYLTWTEMYPNQPDPWRDLSYLQRLMGHPELAIEPARKALAVDPASSYSYGTLCGAFFYVGRLEEAKAVCHQALDRNLPNPHLLSTLYDIAVFQHDTATANDMQRRMVPFGGGADPYSLLALGKAKEGAALWLTRGRQLRTDGFTEHADLWDRILLRREADYNLNDLLREQLISIDQTKMPQNIVIANAELGRVAAAQAGLKLLDTQPDIDTSDKEVNFPQARAAVALARHKPLEAVAELEVAHTYDSVSFEQVLMRADAYLAAHQPAPAATEYRKIIDHGFINCTTQVLPLAHLGLARALEMQGDHPAARQEYETLFTLWKDADADLPPLLKAHAEYTHIPK